MLFIIIISACSNYQLSGPRLELNGCDHLCDWACPRLHMITMGEGQQASSAMQVCFMFNKRACTDHFKCLLEPIY